MTEMNDRRLPVGIQSFEKIRKEGYLYVDKTDMIWKLAHSNKANLGLHQDQPHPHQNAETWTIHLSNVPRCLA